MKNSIPQKDFYVYLLVDELDHSRPDGVFYVGFGKAERLRTTILEAGHQSSPMYFSKKSQKIREMWSQGREPRQDIVFSGNSKYKALRCEDFFIQKYGHHLTNHRGVHSKYPQYSHYAGYSLEDEDEDIIVTMRHPDPDKLVSAISAAKELHSREGSEASEEVLAFLVDLQRQFFPGMVEEEPPTELAKAARDALVASDSHLFRHIIQRRLSVTEQNQWLDTIAKQFIEISMQTRGNPRQSGVIWEYFREQGCKFEDADIFVLTVRFRRAGLIFK